MKKFIIDALERAIKTFIQTFAATLTVEGVAFNEIDWLNVLSVAGVAALASILTSLASYKIGDEGTASVISTEE